MIYILGGKNMNDDFDENHSMEDYYLSMLSSEEKLYLSKLMSNFEKNRVISEEIGSFEELNLEYKMLHQTYAHSFDSLNSEVGKKIFRMEYATGGKTIHRGYYSPSALDMIVMGRNRGRLLKRKPKPHHYDYEYFFDKDDQLIAVHKHVREWEPSVYEIEFIIYEGSNTLSLVYEPYNDYRLFIMTKTQSENGQLMRFENAFRTSVGDEMTEIDVETFEYEDGKMNAFCWSHYTPSLRLLDQLRYVLSRDEDGYYSTYTVEDLNKPNPKANDGDNLEPYNVLGRRK